MVVHVTLAGFLSTKAGKAWFRAVCPRAVDGGFHQFHSSFRPKASRGAVPKTICWLVWPQGEAADKGQAEQNFPVLFIHGSGVRKGKPTQKREVKIPTCWTARCHKYQGDVKGRRPQRIRIWECATTSVGNPWVKPPAVLIGEMVGYDFVKDERWNQWSRPHVYWQTFDNYWPQSFFVFNGVSYPALLSHDTWWVMNFPRLGYGHPGHPVGTYFNHPTIVNENISKRTQGREPGTLKQSQRVEWSFHLNPWMVLGRLSPFFFWMVYFQELHSLKLTYPHIPSK